MFLVQYSVFFGRRRPEMMYFPRKRMQRTEERPNQAAAIAYIVLGFATRRPKLMDGVRRRETNFFFSWFKGSRKTILANRLFSA